MKKALCRIRILHSAYEHCPCLLQLDYSTYWRHYVYDHMFADILEISSSLRRLHLHGDCDGLDDVLSRIFEHSHSTLESLQMNISATAPHFRCWKTLAYAGPSALRKLVLSSHQPPPGEGRTAFNSSFMDIVRCGPALEKLHLTQIPMEGWDGIFESTGELKALKILKLKGCPGILGVGMGAAFRRSLSLPGFFIDGQQYDPCKERHSAVLNALSKRQP